MQFHELEIDGVEFSIQDRTILKDVYLSVKSGQVTTLFGPNGSGKSSLLKILFHVIKPASATIRWNKSYVKNPRLVSGLITYCPQVHFLHPYLRVEEVYRLFSIDSRWMPRVSEVMDVDLKSRVGQLSGGKRRLLEVLVCLLSGQKFVLLDEPFSHLSPVWVESLQSLIRDAAEFSGILITDHQYLAAEKVSDAMYLCLNGSVREINGLNDLRNSPYLSLK